MDVSTPGEAIRPSGQRSSEPRAVPLRVIEPRSGWARLGIGELWRYRELLWFLVWRDIKVRYKQTVLGILWAVLQPLLTMLVFTLFFGKLAGFENRTGGVPYPIYVYAGLLPWTFLASSVTSASSSVIGSTSLVTKVYFPRLLIPLGAVGPSLVDLGISALLLLGMMAGYGILPSWQLILVPAILSLTILAAAGVGTLLAALNVSYRDFRYVVPFMVQLWMFVTPVIYPSSLVPEGWRRIMAINPMTGLVEGFRAAFLALPMPWMGLGMASAVSSALFLGSVLYFRSVERHFADVI